MIFVLSLLFSLALCQDTTDICPDGVTPPDSNDWCPCTEATCGAGCGCANGNSQCGFCQGETINGQQNGCKAGMIAYWCGSGGCRCGTLAGDYTAAPTTADTCPAGTVTEVQKPEGLWCQCTTATCGSGCGCANGYSSCGWCGWSSDTDGYQNDCKSGMVAYGCGSGGCYCGTYASDDVVIPVESSDTTGSGGAAGILVLIIFCIICCGCPICICILVALGFVQCGMIMGKQAAQNNQQVQTTQMAATV